MPRNQPKTEAHPDRNTARSTQRDTHKNILSHKSKNLDMPRERHPHSRLQTHRNVCPDTPRCDSLPSALPGSPLPHTRNLPCSLGKCPHAGRVGPSRSPPPAHSGCLCGPRGTRSSGNRPGPHIAHQPDTTAPAAALHRKHVRNTLPSPSPITHSTTQPPCCHP